MLLEVVQENNNLMSVEISRNKLDLVQPLQKTMWVPNRDHRMSSILAGNMVVVGNLNILDILIPSLCKRDLLKVRLL